MRARWEGYRIRNMAQSETHSKKEGFLVQKIMVMSVMGFFACLGLGLIFDSLRVRSVTCTRLEPSLIDCKLETRLLGFVPLASQAVPKLQGARVEKYCYDRSCSYPVYLDSEQEAILFRSGDAHKEEAAIGRVAKINEFVQNSEAQVVVIEEDISLLSVLVGIIFVVVALLAIFLFFDSIREKPPKQSRPRW